MADGQNGLYPTLPFAAGNQHLMYSNHMSVSLFSIVPVNPVSVQTVWFTVSTRGGGCEFGMTGSIPFQHVS